VFSISFVAMESSLTFLAADRFHYSVRQNTWLLGFLGVCSIITQGYIVRKLLKTMSETRVLGTGLIASALGLLAIGLSAEPWSQVWFLYAGIALLATGSGLVNPSTSGLISLYASASEQGRVLGIFRSLGSLTRAFTPVLAGVVFWRFGAQSVFFWGAAFAVIAFAMGLTLPQPEK
jgi:MFS family permease